MSVEVSVENALSPANEKQLIHVLIVDSTLLESQLLAGALERTGRFDVVGVTISSRESLALAHRNPNVALIGATLADGAGSGFELARRLRAFQPGIQAVMLLDASKSETVVEAFRCGATGIVCRDEPIEILCECICRVHEGQVWATHEELKFFLDAVTNSTPSHSVKTEKLRMLTQREQQVVRLAGEGLSNPEIAGELRLSKHTVKNCMAIIFQKLEVSSRIEMVLAALGQTLPVHNSAALPELVSEGRIDDRALFEWYQEAARHHLSGVQLTMGQMCVDGRGTPKDLVTGYMWFLISEMTGSSDLVTSKGFRDSLRSQMTCEQLAEADQRAAAWLREHPSHLQAAPVTNYPARKGQANSKMTSRPGARSATAVR
jgi:DNA-binding NarL/FixJ family response regulator